MMASRMTNSRGIQEKKRRYDRIRKEEYSTSIVTNGQKALHGYRTYTQQKSAVEIDDDGSVHVITDVIDTTHGQG